MNITYFDDEIFHRVSDKVFGGFVNLIYDQISIRVRNSVYSTISAQIFNPIQAKTHEPIRRKVFHRLIS